MEYEKQLKKFIFYKSFDILQVLKTRTECKDSLFMLFFARDFENHVFHFGEDGFCSDI